MLTVEDIRDFLTGFAAAIELDQNRVDALPQEAFRPGYDDGMWRWWRKAHLDYIHRVLLPSIDEMPVTILRELTWSAQNYPAAVVRKAAINSFSEAASGSCPAEEHATASLFFGWLIKDVTVRPFAAPQCGAPKRLVMEWLPVTDPLGIAQDPECGYELPKGFVS
jgi:hypothetical protein